MNHRYQILILVAVAACVFFLRLGSLPLTEPDEGRNAEVAREMIVLDDWITPHYNTLPYLDKPAVFFWLVAGSQRLFGVSEGAARLPSALAALATLLLVWLLARRMFGESAGMAAGLIFATAPLAMAFARVVVFDMTLTFLVTLAFAAFWLTHTAERGRRNFDYLMFAAAGAATITKGPVGFLVPVLAILLYAWIQRRFADLRKIAWLPGIAIFLAVSLPWFVAVSMRNPGFPRYAFWNESIVRFTTARAHRSGSVFYYIPVFLVGFMPWSFTLSFAGLNRVKSWRRLRDPKRAAEAFLLSWALTVFVLFSLSHSKLPAYFLPAIPALAVLMGKIWSEDVGGDPARPRPDWLTAGYALLIALGLLLAAAPAWLQLPSVHKLAAAKIHPRVIELLNSSIFPSGVILAALGVLGRNQAARKQRRYYAAKCFAVLAVSMPLLAVCWWQPLSQYALVTSSKSLAQAIEHAPEHGIPVYGYYYYRTSLPFYLRRPVGLVTADGDEFTSNYIIARWPALESDRSFKMAAGGVNLPLVMTGSEFAALGRSPPTPFLVMVQNDETPDMEKLQGVIEPLWQAWKYSVWEIGASAGPPSQALLFLPPESRMDARANVLKCSTGCAARPEKTVSLRRALR